MKIVYLLTRMSEWGGAQVHVRDLSVCLKSMGHDIHVITGDMGSVTEALQAAGVTVHLANGMQRAILPTQDIKAIFQIWRLLRQLKPDLLSCHSSKAGVLGRIAATLAGVPVIFTAHGYAFTDNTSRLKSLIYMFIEFLMRPFSDFVITVSEYDRQNALAAHLMPPGRIRTVHNGMPDLPAPQRDPATTTGPCRLIMVARFAAQKDHAVLLRALASLRDLNWNLRLIGGGDDTAATGLIRTLGLGDRVTILGQRSDVGDQLAASDVFILTTHWEGFPRSILEAMRAGLPVMATRVAGVPEAVTEGETGMLVPPRDAQAVAYKLRQLIEQPGLRQRMGVAARVRFEAEFTFDHMLTKTMAIYKEVTDKDVLI